MILSYLIIFKILLNNIKNEIILKYNEYIIEKKKKKI